MLVSRGKDLCHVQLHPPWFEPIVDCRSWPALWQMTVCIWYEFIHKPVLYHTLISMHGDNLLHRTIAYNTTINMELLKRDIGNLVLNVTHRCVMWERVICKYEPTIKYWQCSSVTQYYTFRFQFVSDTINFMRKAKYICIWLSQYLDKGNSLSLFLDMRNLYVYVLYNDTKGQTLD